MALVVVGLLLIVVIVPSSGRIVASTRVAHVRRTVELHRTVSGRGAGGGEPVRWSPNSGLQLLLATVAASVRAGRSPHEAWQQVGVANQAGVPRTDVLQAAAAFDLGARDRWSMKGPLARIRRVHVSRRAARARGRRRWGNRELLAAEQAVAVRGACAVALQLGAPLADVLDEVTRSLTEHREAVDERRAALAGPRASAEVLGWLPLLTVLGGALLGASPWRTATDGSLGTLTVVAGVLLVLVGRRWTGTLLERAERRGAS